MDDARPLPGRQSQPQPSAKPLTAGGVRLSVSCCKTSSAGTASSSACSLGQSDGVQPIRRQRRRQQRRWRQRWRRRRRDRLGGTIRKRWISSSAGRPTGRHRPARSPLPHAQPSSPATMAQNASGRPVRPARHPKGTGQQQHRRPRGAGPRAVASPSLLPLPLPSRATNRHAGQRRTDQRHGRRSQRAAQRPGQPPRSHQQGHEGQPSDQSGGRPSQQLRRRAGSVGDDWLDVDMRPPRPTSLLRPETMPTRSATGRLSWPTLPSTSSRPPSSRPPPARPLRPARRRGGSFPGEFRLAATEMPAGGRLAVDRPPQVEILDDPARRQGKDLATSSQIRSSSTRPVPSVSTSTLTGSDTPMA